MLQGLVTRMEVVTRALEVKREVEREGGTRLGRGVLRKTGGI